MKRRNRFCELKPQVSLTDEQREELERRLEAYRRDPEAGSPWEAVKARIRRS